MSSESVEGANESSASSILNTLDIQGIVGVLELSVSGLESVEFLTASLCILEVERLDLEGIGDGDLAEFKNTNFHDGIFSIFIAVVSSLNSHTDDLVGSGVSGGASGNLNGVQPAAEWLAILAPVDTLALSVVSHVTVDGASDNIVVIVPDLEAAKLRSGGISASNDSHGTTGALIGHVEGTNVVNSKALCKSTGQTSFLEDLSSVALNVGGVGDR